MEKIENFVIKILTLIRPPLERKLVYIIVSAGITLIISGLQGFRWMVELFLHIIQIESKKRLGVDYSINTINWTSIIFGVILIISGLLLHSYYKNLENKHTKPKKLFISIIHKSIDNFIKPNYSKLDEFNINEYSIQEIDIDQTKIYTNGNLEYPEVSLLYQKEIIPKIEALTNNNNDFEISYFGLAHIPLIWDLGTAIADKFPISYYEYDRKVNNWKKIRKSSDSNNSFFTSDHRKSSDISKNAIIKIEISYEIDDLEIIEVVKNYKYLTTIKLNSIGLDKIKSLNQIDSLTECFRNEVDFIIKDSTIENIDIFYSGPVSLALSMSRKISKRTDTNFTIYNYTRNSSPKYKWALNTSNNNPKILKF